MSYNSSLHWLLFDYLNIWWWNAPFLINAGILQGDTLAPFLFIIVVDYVLRMSIDTISSKGYEIKPRRITRHPAQYITDTDFADEIALISESLVNAQSLLQSLEQASNCVSLYLNEKKTEYMNKCNNDSDFIIKTIQDKLLKWCQIMCTIYTIQRNIF